jgi:protein-tyrosine phosphatase
MAHWFLKEKVVHFLATDAHDTARRPPVLSEARKMVAKQFGEELAAALVEENPRAVVNDQPLACFKQ